MKSVVTFYRFVDIDDPAALKAALEPVARSLELKGTVLLAHEGINATLTGNREALETLVGWLRARDGFAGLPCRYSAANAENPVFHRLKVRLRAEIVTLGEPDVAPARRTGTHVDAERWNALLADPDVVVVDTRNGYEIVIGTFPGALNPGTSTFREFPRFVAEQLEHDGAPAAKVAMFCTGGIRCEKASAYLLERGFPEVYQLDGGILRYLDTVAAAKSRFEGECFVFDQRVSVDATLEQGRFTQCFACRRPLDDADLVSEHYVEGVSCPHCVESHDDRARAAFAERARQVALAAERGTIHIGSAMPEPAAGRQRG